nr:TonB-dependent receptor [uncultured Sphingomonas sp.]
MNPFVPVVSPLIQHNKFHTRHVLARWKRSFSDNFDMSAQVYFNNLYRTEFGTTIDRDLYDASIEGRWKANASNEFNFGVAGRISSDKVGNTFSLSLPAQHNVDRWVTAYLQDEITLIPDQLKLTIGSKFEKNNFTGVEIQPSARVLYRASPAFAVWASVSRAVRTPLLLQRGMVANVTQLREIPGFGVIPVNSTFTGSTAAKSERVISYEAGFRGSLGRSWSYDVAGFVSNYSKLTTGNLYSSQIVTVSVPYPPYVIPVGLQLNHLVGNSGKGKGKGFEALATGPLTDWWKLEVSYSYLDFNVTSDPNTYTLTGDSGSSRHQLRAKSSMTLSEHLRLDTDVHYVSRSNGGERPAYTDLDIRGTYQVNPNLELSIVGSNLLKKRRLEFYQDTLPLELVYVPRSAFAEARFRF